MSNINWDDYSEEFPFGNIVSVFSNKNSGLIKTNDLYSKSGYVNNFGIYFKNINTSAKNDAKYKSNIYLLIC